MINTIANTPLSYTLLNALPVAVYTCDKDGRITWFNDAAVGLWGRAPEKNQELWTGALKILKPDGQPLPLHNCPMARAIKEGVAIDGQEIIIEQPDGKQVNVLTHPVPLFDDDGVLTGAINTLLDVTEQRNSERKQAMLAAIVTTSDDAIVSKTLEGIITSWNGGAQQLFGYTEEEVIGRHITILIPHERLQEETEILTKIRKGERVEHYKTYRRHKNGTEIPVSLAISPIKDRKGNVIGASKIARNVYKQQLAENTLQQYAENLELLNTIGKTISENLDVQEILQKVTDATTTLTGAAFGAFFYNKLDEQGESYMLYTLSGAPREAFEKFGMPRNTDVFAHTFNGLGIVRVDDITKDPRYGHNHPHYGMPKGHLPVVSYLAVPVVSKSGEVIGGLFLGHPEAGRFTREHEMLVSGVSSQASVALDNAQMYEEIQKLNSKKDEFIGLASHELKTPMTSLNGYLQIIDRSLGENDRNKVFIQKALSQINKLSDLISDLLDVSKIEAGKLPFSLSTFNLPELVDEVADLMQYSTKTHRIIICSDIHDLVVHADKQRIEQVMINLISNAIKYSPQADMINISVSASHDKAAVTVQDFGMGISKEQQERIFSRFYRVDDLASHISGLGIGLYISKDIITRHGGRLYVESEPGKGSTFGFEIPLKQ
ncbi:PAS domain S-box protein [Mucilaginibacter sp. 14171R-50]|uniref:PAS domain S-box protein n=1 Tax=Mucilaginibacter sp. 14171R-50 TaxID=2703789 RepID=UPI00138C0D16|nr:PAS domain S-box protein [Mucilaginibacter sp. 14171R-50]QHS56310.1 PAS domain S-box protein [Mucilaginibacter sp. 14171R-50]